VRLEEAAAAHLGGPRHSETIEDGGSYVDEAGGFVDAVLGEAFGVGGPVNDEGDVEGGLVDEIAVAGFAVFPKAFAMIGGEDDKGFLKEAAVV